MRSFICRLGPTGLTVSGGLIITAAYVVLATETASWLAPIAVSAIGLGFYMFHNTLQTNATQATPQARGTALATFLRRFISGRPRALVIDHFGAVPLFVGTALGSPLRAAWFAYELRSRRQPIGP